MNEFDRYRPDPSWYSHKPYGIHGMGHAARALVWANSVATQLTNAGSVVDVEAVRWAAVLHDVGRLSDGYDEGHGMRSADWIAINFLRLPVVLDREVLERVSHCCRWHEVSDRDIPEMTAELMCLKDADGLDRVRINDLNPAFLRSKPARMLVDAAWDLCRKTGRSGDIWEIVFQVAGYEGYLLPGTGPARTDQ